MKIDLLTPERFWGKLHPREAPTEWHPLVDHCIDVAACTEALLDGPLLGARLAQSGGQAALDAVQVARLAVLAGLHDLGKLNHGFQNRRPDGPAPWGGHVGCGSAFLRKARELETAARLAEIIELRTLGSWCGGDPGEYLAVVESHHGGPIPLGVPDNGVDSLWRPRFERDPLNGARALMQALRDAFPTAWEDGPALPTSPAALHLYAGIVMLADWVGSDRDRGFRYSEPGDPPRIEVARAAARALLPRIGLDGRRFQDAARETAATFPNLTGIEGAPRPAQDMMLDLPVPEAPSALVLESETGSGKTEAVWIWFARLLQAGLVDGLYFALPTRSAATQIQDRLQLEMLRRLVPDEDARPRVVLAVPGYLRVDDVDGTRLGPHEVLWPDHARDPRTWPAEGAKRYLAGSVVVGTVDQALLSTLRVKHGHLRAAALSRHLLVVDEVHASDAYMTSLLEKVLQRHLAGGGHAVLLSATLGGSARTRLLAPRGRARGPTLEEAIAAPYPLITMRQGRHVTRHIPSQEAASKRVRMEPLPTPAADDLARRLADLASAGARVLVIRNTVAEAVELQVALEAVCEPSAWLSCNGTPALHHGRYAAEDRKLLDRAVEAALGKRSPAGARVVIATQTCEQSLDLDADVLVTDLAPVDVLLQRIGRLHRHAGRARPVAFAQPVCQVLVDEPEELLQIAGRATGRRGFGTDRAYQDVRVVELTRRLVFDRTLWTVPEDCRLLVEQATHPAVLAALDAQDEAWAAHGRTVLGSDLGRRREGGRVSVDWSQPWLELDPFDRDAEGRIGTRLGEADGQVELPQPWISPFGATVRALRIPAWMAPHQADLAAAEVITADDHIQLTLGNRLLVYDRFGLQLLKEPA